MNDMHSGLNAIILTYHSISEGSPPLCISPDIFAAQMKWLKSNANVIPLELLAESLAQGKLLPPETVALTFDDGFTDFYSVAAPLLKRLGLPGIVFLTAACCGKVASWISPSEERSLMTWAQIRDLAGRGVSFGSHSMNHPILTGSKDSELAHELSESKRLIEAETGREVRFFCYPYGRHNERVRRAVSTWYSGGACTTDLCAAGSAADRFALPRIDAHYVRNIAIFRSMFSARFQLYIRARRILRNMRTRVRPV
jgi:peptidoglycan/xylan/chitin deacetylase (PgdA/CDA1 family)